MEMKNPAKNAPILLFSLFFTLLWGAGLPRLGGPRCSRWLNDGGAGASPAFSETIYE